jgi:hypothetical protein
MSKRAPSIPDRRRMESDVRAFLRAPSTPWITFDRDSKVAAGESPIPQIVVSSFRSSIHDGIFAKANANEIPIREMPELAPSSRVEPSGMTVAHDIASEDVHVPVGDDDDAYLPKPNRAVKWVAMGMCALTALAIAAVGISGAKKQSESRAAAVAFQVTTPVDTSAREVPAPPPPVEAAPTPEPAPAPAPKAEAPRAKATTGRIEINSEVAKGDVWLDGKRLLGRGARHFDIVCGNHTIAIAKKSDAHTMDVPCGGELILSSK